MRRRLTRRDALRILGAGACLPLGALAVGMARDTPEPVQWHGSVLGALSSMTLWHVNPKVAERAIAQMRVEINRLEDIFSLYRPASEISRFNAAGTLNAPSADLLTVLGQSQRIADISGGAFDPTIQPLWRLHTSSGPDGKRLDPLLLDSALKLVGYEKMSAEKRGLRFATPGMGISLNGIAQGFITDRITEILGNEGFESAMIELGETRALGMAPEGRPFSVSLVDPFSPSQVGHTLSLSSRALAVSAGYGTPFSGDRHHIFDPSTGQSANRLRQVAVLSPKAMWADALSTAIYVSGEASAPGLLAAYPGSNAMLSRNDGSVVEL